MVFQGYPDFVTLDLKKTLFLKAPDLYERKRALIVEKGVEEKEKNLEKKREREGERL